MRQIEQAKDVSKTEQLHAGRTICNTGIASHAWNKGKAAYKGWKAPAALAAMALCVTLACGCGEPEKIENAAAWERESVTFARGLFSFPATAISSAKKDWEVSLCSEDSP